jgi:DNA-binding HxlR family transcriptional regulator
MKNKLKLLKSLSKKANLTILLSLKEGSKKWSELSTLLYPRDLHNGLKELLNLGLIAVIIIPDSPTGSKAYELTPLGRKIVQLIEEMEKEFEEYHSHLPKEPDKFINELLEGD